MGTGTEVRKPKAEARKNPEFLEAQPLAATGSRSSSFLVCRRLQSGEFSLRLNIARFQPEDGLELPLRFIPMFLVHEPRAIIKPRRYPVRIESRGIAKFLSCRVQVFG